MKIKTLTKNGVHLSRISENNIQSNCGKILHVTLQDCPRQAGWRGRSGWAWESLQLPEWGKTSRGWVEDAVAGELVGDGVVSR